MDDKATLKPGTDIGMKGTRKQSVITSTSLIPASTNSNDGTLPQHDFSELKVHIKPSPFRYMTKQIDDVSD